jgi:hypothetical protein
MPRVETLAGFLGTDQADLSAPTELPQLTVKEFCQGVLESREYRQSVITRIALGTLPAALELRMYDYAYGKPPDKVEHSGPDGQPIETVTEVRRVIVRASEAKTLLGELQEEHDERKRKAQVTH